MISQPQVGNIVIVTINFNDSTNLEATIASVRLYKEKFQKYIIIDGHSSDNSIRVIEQNLDIIDAYISEDDSGIYDAMNKVKKFSIDDNDLLIWLNAGDTLTDWSGINIKDFFLYDCVFCAVNTKLHQTSTNEKIVYPVIKLPYNERNFFPSSVFMHQGFFIKFSLFKKYSYDLKVGLQAENLLMSKCIQNDIFLVSERVVSTFYLDGLSSKNFSSILLSYLKVALGLNFNLFKIFYFQFTFLIKTFIKIILPYSIFNLIRQTRI